MHIAPIKHLTAANEDFQIGLAAAQSIFEVIDAPAEIDQGQPLAERASGRIEFRNVNLRYENDKR